MATRAERGRQERVAAGGGASASPALSAEPSASEPPVASQPAATAGELSVAPVATKVIELLAELAAAERHEGRRYELQVFAYECGLVDDEAEDEEPDHRQWVRPEDR